MTDSADQLTAAICQVINDAVQAALKAHQRPKTPSPRTPTPDDERPPERILHPVNEVAQKLGVGRSTVYQLLGDGRLPSVKIGSRRFVTAAALRAYVEGLE